MEAQAILRIQSESQIQISIYLFAYFFKNTRLAISIEVDLAKDNDDDFFIFILLSRESLNRPSGLVVGASAFVAVDWRFEFGQIKWLKIDIYSFPSFKFRQQKFCLENKRKILLATGAARKGICRDFPLFSELRVTLHSILFLRNKCCDEQLYIRFFVPNTPLCDTCSHNGSVH